MLPAKDFNQSWEKKRCNIACAYNLNGTCQFQFLLKNGIPLCQKRKKSFAHQCYQLLVPKLFLRFIGMDVHCTYNGWLFQWNYQWEKFRQIKTCSWKHCIQLTCRSIDVIWSKGICLIITFLKVFLSTQRYTVPKPPRPTILSIW